MRVLELEIHNVRGIVDLKLTPEGKNFAVWGPNGSGKSAVVDAIDFLLTGGISRLTGKGTRGITLGRYGHHIDREPKDAIVGATIKLPGVAEPVKLKRCMARSAKLEYDERFRQYLDPIMSLARRGQHVLTRRDILKYITADAGTRAQEIQVLLDVAEVEAARKTLVKVQNTLQRQYKAAKSDVRTNRGRVNATVQATTFCEDAVLQAVNRNRAVLGGPPIGDLASAKLKAGLQPPTVVAEDRAVNVTLLEKDIQNLRKVVLEKGQRQLAEDDEQLRHLVTAIRSDPESLRALSRLQLIKLGIELIDDTGSCPLCDTPWPPGELSGYLGQRLSAARAAAGYQNRINKLCDTIAQSVHGTAGSLEELVKATRLIGLKDELMMLESWLSDLQSLSAALSAPVERYPDPRFSSDRVKGLLSPAELGRILDHVSTAVKTRYPETTPEQDAWDTLTRLETQLEALESAEAKAASAELNQKRAAILLAAFLKARDSVLGELYDDVRDRFVDLYRQLHGHDEGEFVAKMKHEEAALNLEVDFYGRGTHPPHALHSEGHQDSMGLCLYLALAERLNKGLIGLVILDDVVMSVDTDHRRQVCHVLATCFPDRQFFITTHDRTWANQLKTEGVIGSQGLVEFYNWHIDTGPQVDYQPEMWQWIEGDLGKNDVPAAAGRLRRGSERFFAEVCDALRAPVTYKLNGRWDLGDFLPAAMGKYRRLLKEAKQAANSWNDRDCIETLAETQSTTGQVFDRTRAEQWAVNANVHYDNWRNFSPSDFRPVVEAFQDLYDVFRCSDCGGMLYLTMKGMQGQNVRCNCEKVNWNLIGKSKTS